MRKFSCLVIASVLMLSWVSCDDDETTPSDVGTDVADMTGGDAPEDVADEGDLSGPVVTVMGAIHDPGTIAALEASFAAFETETGADVQYMGSPDFEADLLAAVASGSPPDIAFIPQPGFVHALAADGALIDMATFTNATDFEDAFGAYMTSLVTTGSSIWAGWWNLDVKSLIWYPKAAFDTAGYTVPTDWAGLIALSDEIVEDGDAPWCVGFESGGATGWPGTDWIEDIMLRTAGPAVYDQWVNHEIAFNDSRVKAAFEVLGEIVFIDGYVYGGHEDIASTSFGDVAPMAANPPECWLKRQASFLAFFFPPETTMGTDFNAFLFPTIDDTLPQAMLGGGNAFAMFNDRPEVRAFVEFLLTAEAGEGAAQLNAGYLSAHVDFDTTNYLIPFQALQGEAAQTALENDGFRFDASDLMPPGVGQGAFWAGMVDYVTNGPDNLDQVLLDIENAWPTE